MNLTSRPLTSKVTPNIQRVLIGLCGVITVLVAIKVTAYSGQAESFANQHALMRMTAFAALTVWTTLTLGIHKRGAAAIIVLAFASIVELVIVPGRSGGVGTLVAANLGIVLAYCGFQLYWFRVEKPRKEPSRTDAAPKLAEAA